MPPVLVIDITDTCGSRRSFQAERANLDCGSGELNFQAGGAAFARKFDNGVLTVFHPAGDTVVSLHNCTASLSADALHILCEDFHEEVRDERPPGLKSVPAEWPEMHKPHNP